MIRITLYRDGENRLTGFQAKGHAEYADAGKDIVCAAVSVLTTTCVNALEAVAGVTPKVTVRDGYLTVALPSSMSEAQMHDAQIILRSMKQGLEDVEETAKEYVKLSIQERRETK